VTERRKIRVLVAEDSAAMRETLIALLGADPMIEVIGAAIDGVRAVELARTLRPDVVTMDILMPHLDGVEATAAIMAHAPARVLVVSSVADRNQVDLTFHAMAAGALEVIGKPTGSGPDALRRWGTRLCEAVRLMAEVPVITRRHSRARTASGRRVDVLGASRRPADRLRWRASSATCRATCPSRSWSRSTSRTVSSRGSCGGSSRSRRCASS
jgi:two-component system chemotaxis response regulator CheB